MQAEEREENKGKNKDSSAGVQYGDYGGWHKAAKVDRYRYLLSLLLGFMGGDVIITIVCR